LAANFYKLPASAGLASVFRELLTSSDSAGAICTVLILVQNDPWLRGNVVRMISHGAVADANMMHENFPNLHQVYHDRYGSVWSAK
jgi:hypothetical protein